MQSNYTVPASEIELETGFGKELLRKWRQRYGFPIIETGDDGKVGYLRNSIHQLQLIKRLLEAGFRPAQIVGKPLLELKCLLRAIENDKPEQFVDKSTRKLLELLKINDMVGIQSILAKERESGSLSSFVLTTVAPLISEVGNAWLRNEIEIYHEHLCTSAIQRFLHAEILLCKPKSSFPTILFATPPHELHVLGLLMAEAVLADHGAKTFCLGSHIPLNDIKLAAASFKANVVALSFGFSFSVRNVIPTLKHIRHLLPTNVELWAGGSGLSSIRRPPNGVRIFSNIQDAVVIMQNFKERKNDS